MITNAKGIALIKEHEGWRAKKYTDSAGHPTIGYGHKILPNEALEEITKEQGERILMRDIAIAETGVNNLIRVPLTSHQFSALVSFVFNLGAGALAKSTMRHFLNKRDYIEAANEFPKWVFAGGKRLPGLVKRREAERQLFLTKET